MVDMGFNSVSLRPEMDIRLLDTEVRGERPELTDDDGDDDGGVDTSELSGLSGDAIDVAIEEDVKEEEELRGKAEGVCTDVGAGEEGADEEKYTEEAGQC